MILSMTGYGRCVKQLPDKIVTVEIKSLNSKSFDLNLRMPSYYRDRELDIRNILSQRLERGKIDLSIQLESTANTAPALLNEKVVRDYLKQLKTIVDGDETELLKMAVRMPDALLAKPEHADENEWQEIFNALQEAATQLFVFRKTEGKVLHDDFSLRIQNIQNMLANIEALDAERLEVVKLRLRKAVDNLEAAVDENRFEQELIYYIEKFDITEEKVRLKNHLDYFSENLDSPESNGKKLGFISQEIGREINTIGSKANHAATQQLVVQMKDELEKLKEQLLNIL